MFFRSVQNLFKEPSAQEQAKRELADAKREWLRACTQLEYATAIREYNMKRITRLEQLLSMPEAPASSEAATTRVAGPEKLGIGFLAGQYKEQV